MTIFNQIRNIPFDLSVLGSLFPQNKQIVEKARSLEKAGRIIRLKKGMYVASKEETGIELSRELIANHLYGPSYVGREYALRYYGLIPERVYLLTSVTTKHARSFENETGFYAYQNCSIDYFPIGLKIESSNGICFIIATPEKALCDVVNFSSNVNLRSLRDVKVYLEEDIRFDTSELAHFDIGLMEQCAAVSRRKNSINMLIKYIRHVKHL